MADLNDTHDQLRQAAATLKYVPLAKEGEIRSYFAPEHFVRTLRRIVASHDRKARQKWLRKQRRKGTKRRK